MTSLTRLATLVGTLLLTQHIEAQLVIDPPQPITHRIIVNPIRSISSSGEAATAFGGQAQQTDIISKINQIWAQVGFEIQFLPFKDFVDDFTHNNNGQSGTRSTGDLRDILNLPDLPRTGSNTVIDMIFVEAAPGFPSLSGNTAAGLARVDAQGTTIFVGSRLLNFSSGRTTIASVVAHEIGHNLGLPHTAGGSANLMASPGGSSEQISSDQVDRIFTDSNFRIDGFDLLEEVSTTPPPSQYDQFVEANNLQGGPLDDDDRDGLTNLTEFAINTDPTRPGDTLPPITRVAPDEFRWSIPKRPQAVTDGILFNVSVTKDLEIFRPAASQGSNSIISTNNDDRITTRLFGAERGFFRLTVNQPNAALQSELTPELATQLHAQDDPSGEKLLRPIRLCACGEDHD